MATLVASVHIEVKNYFVDAGCRLNTDMLSHAYRYTTSCDNDLTSHVGHTMYIRHRHVHVVITSTVYTVVCNVPIQHATIESSNIHDCTQHICTTINWHIIIDTPVPASATCRPPSAPAPAPAPAPVPATHPSARSLNEL